MSEILYKPERQENESHAEYKARRILMKMILKMKKKGMVIKKAK